MQSTKQDGCRIMVPSRSPTDLGGGPIKEIIS
jgi:hypothetical protein